MKKQLSISLNRVLSLLLLLLATNQAFAQNAAIGYQGRLTEGGSPATGTYDIQFKLFDAAAHGAGLQQSSTITKSAVPVANGVFTVTLDFEARVFTGPPRWLEIEVRRNGGGAFTTLIPRQAILPVPQAIYAQTAGSVPSGTVLANQLNTGGIAPTAGQFLSYNGGNFLWRDSATTSGSVFSLNGADAYYNAGNVGLGTSTVTPGVRLEVSGATHLKPGNGGVQFGSPNAELGMSITPNAGNRADLRFNGSVLKLAAGPGPGPPSELNGLAITTAGNVGIGKINPGSKLDVVSDTTTAIVGKSTSSDGVGVYGESAQSNGVRGLAHNANHGGVVGVHDGGGIAVYGTGGIGVQGDSTSGIAVYGRSQSGAAVHAEGNAVQAREKGGFVKAMAFLHANGSIMRCYNGITGASTVEGSGITSVVLAEGVYRVAFPFQVDDRFISVTAQYGPGNSAPNNLGANFRFVSGNPRNVDVFLYDANDGDDTFSWSFMILVF